MKLKRKDINKFVKPFAAHKWYDLGIELEVGDEDGFALDEIRDKHGENKEDCFDRMLSLWLKEANASQLRWEVLLECLKNLKLNDAIQSLQSNVFGGEYSDLDLEELISLLLLEIFCFLDSSAEINTQHSSADTSAATINATSSPSATKALLNHKAPAPMKEALYDDKVFTSKRASDLSLSIDASPISTTKSQEGSTSTKVENANASQKSTLLESGNSFQESTFNTPEPLEPLVVSHKLEDQADGSGKRNYSLQLQGEHKIRNYQQELAEPGIRGDNYIFVAPTGSGKTLVTAIIICEHLKRLQALGEIPRVIFLVSTKPLAVQQRERLQEYIGGAKVECIVGDNSGSIKKELTQCEVVVCTTGKFLNELKRGLVSLAPPSPNVERKMITLLVMDECHHARKSSPQAQVMHHYLQQKLEGHELKMPQMIGLTASPGAGDNPNLEIEKTIDHLVNLCALLDATSGIATVRQNVDELESFTTKPMLSQDSRPSRSQAERFISLMESEMVELERIGKLKCSFPKWSQQYETTANRTKMPLEISTNPTVRDQISALKLLICYSQALNIYMDLRKEDALKILEDYRDLPDKDETCTECEIELKRDLNELISKLKLLPYVENALLKRAEEIIVGRFKEAPESRGVFFVRTKCHAYAVCEWIKSLATSFPFLKPQVITGHTRDTGHGMTQADQEVAMNAFRSGECNILVATSVAEEGLDVPACNFVIRFQHVSNEIAKAQTQGRARAEDSEVITILSSNSPVGKKEIQNAERLELVSKIIGNNWFPRGALLQGKLKEQQGAIVRMLKLKQLFKQQRESVRRDKVKIMCRKCKTTACFGSDVFTAENSTHYVIPGDEIKTKLIKKPHHTPGRMSKAISKTHKIHCKKCDAVWGIMCIWPKEGFEFPILKCKYFVFQVDEGTPFPVAQWCKAPFKPLPLDAWIEEQASDGENSETDDL